MRWTSPSETIRGWFPGLRTRMSSTPNALMEESNKRLDLHGDFLSRIEARLPNLAVKGAAVNYNFGASQIRDEARPHWEEPPDRIYQTPALLRIGRFTVRSASPLIGEVRVETPPPLDRQSRPVFSMIFETFPIFSVLRGCAGGMVFCC